MPHGKLVLIKQCGEAIECYGNSLDVYNILEHFCYYIRKFFYYEISRQLRTRFSGLT